MIEETTPLLPEDKESRGEDGNDDVYGILTDLDQLEELLEDLDELGATTRDAIDIALLNANKQAGDREADEMISRLESIMEAMIDYGVASREDIVAKLVEYENNAEDVENGEKTFEF